MVLGRAIGSDVGVGRVQDSGSDAHASTDANGERADTGAAPRCTRVEVRSASSLPEDRDASVMPPTAIAEGDFDQDGKLDVVVLGPNPFGLSLHDDVHLFANRGAPNFDVSDFSSGIYDESSFATGDFDGDGKLDLAIVGIGFGPGLSVLLNRGGSFEKPVLYGYDESNVDSGVGSANRLIASGDLDGMASSTSQCSTTGRSPCSRIAAKVRSPSSRLFSCRRRVTEMRRRSAFSSWISKATAGWTSSFRN